MKKIFILPVFFFFFIIGFSQREIHLKKGFRKLTISEGMSIGITRKGESNVYSSWKTTCKSCDSTVTANTWEVYGIHRDSIVIRRVQSIRSDTLTEREAERKSEQIDVQKWKIDTIFQKEIIQPFAFKYDTLTRSQKRQVRRKIKKNYISPDSVFFDTLITTQKVYVYHHPEEYLRKSIPYDSIASFTFAEGDDCSGRKRILLSSFLSTAFGIYETNEVLKQKINVRPTLYVPTLIILFSGTTLSLADGISEFFIHKVRTCRLDKWKMTIRRSNGNKSEN